MNLTFVANPHRKKSMSRTANSEPICIVEHDCVSTLCLFLDFDGVTHPEPCLKVHEFCFLPLIEDVLREYGAVEVVISSSWRNEYSLDQLRSFFSADIAKRVVGVTPSSKKPTDEWLPGRVGGYERERECDAWMQKNRTWGTPWLAIDDRPHWFRPDCADLLLTSSKVGFQESDKDTLREMIRDRT
jgi:hypothetical protein